MTQPQGLDRLANAVRAARDQVVDDVPDTVVAVGDALTITIRDGVAAVEAHASLVHLAETEILQLIAQAVNGSVQAVRRNPLPDAMEAAIASVDARLELLGSRFDEAMSDVQRELLHGIRPPG